MLIKNISFKLWILMIAITAIFSCQKKERPPLGDYPADQLVTPTTPLRFYVNFDSTSEAAKQINIRFQDSISGYPSFFPDPSITATAGVHGTAVQFSPGNAIKYINANDFATASSYTVAFWLKATGVPHANPQFA